jgi:hypothetical protein
MNMIMTIMAMMRIMTTIMISIIVIVSAFFLLLRGQTVL